MIRFVFHRKALLATGLMTVLFSSVVSIQPCQADTSWTDLLKPLVKDVIIPGASAGMKKWVQKKIDSKTNTINQTDSSAEVITIDPNTSTSAEVITVDPNSATNADITIPTPEPTSSSSSVATFSATDNPPPPPPPPSP